MSNENTLKHDLKLEAEEERPTFSKKDMKNLLKEEIRSAIKEMLMEEDSLVAPSPHAKKLPDMTHVVDIFEPDMPTYDIASNDKPAPSNPNPHDDTSPPADDAPIPAPAQKQPNEWDDYERSQGMADYLDSEWSHKAYLLSTKYVQQEIIKLHDLVLRELSLSNLPDTEIAFIYAVKMDCIEEWMSMGFFELAQQRLVHMLFRLRLMTSVEGLELIAQHGTSSIAMSMDRLQPSREGYSEEEDQQQGKKPSIGVRRILGKLRGR